MSTTILVVEDEAANRKLLSTFLQKSGYTVEAVENASAALSYIDQTTPALVLLDIRLPGMDGLDLTRQLKNQPGTAHIPIVAVTARANPGDEALILNAGCDGYIAKPINFAVLTSYLQHYVPTQ
ncbi:MAG: response regulator [bacterium]|nr:response regulator [bacterium]